MITTTEEKDNTAPLLYTGLPKSISIFKCDGKGYGIFTNVDIEKRRTILKIQGSIVKKTAVQNLNAALQIDDDLFMESRGTFDEYVNHSCSPNCCLDFKGWDLVALRYIQKGEELTFNYNSSEFDLVEQSCSFQCRCGAPNCVGEVKGFKYLSIDRSKKLNSLLSPFLRKKLWRKILQLRLPLNLGI